MDLFSKPEFWSAIASLAWPCVAGFALFKLHPIIASLIKRENMTLKVAGMEISVREATESFGKQITDLQQKLAEIENKSAFKIQETKMDTSENKSPKNRSLLWVDDFPSNNAFIIDKLNEQGIIVQLSLSTEDAINRIRNEKYTAIITDLGRKENGVTNQFAGLELINKLRDQGDSTPVLVFAGARGMENAERLIAAGAETVADSGVRVLGFIEKHFGKT